MVDTVALLFLPLTMLFTVDCVTPLIVHSLLIEISFSRHSSMIRSLTASPIFMDAFSSKDLVNWTKHPKVLSKENISWLRRALWAPAVIHANDKYYFFFGANDIQNNNELGGIGVAVADNPTGPFKDALGKPLIDKIVNGAQPIDQFVFKDDDGQYYMYYGGWEKGWYYNALQVRFR